MTYWLYRLAAWLLPGINEAVGYPVFRLIGSLAYHLAPRTRTMVSRNMRVVLGPAASEKEVQRQTQAAFRNLACNYYELFRLRSLSPESLRARIDMTGVEHLDSALQRGKGVLLAGMHFGNTESLMQIPALFPYMHFTLLAEKLADARLFELLRSLRAAMGIEIVSVEEPLKIIRALKQNRVVGIAIDRDVTHSGVEISFLGKPAVLPDGIVRLAMRTGAAIVPAYGWMDHRCGHMHVRVLPALDLTQSRESSADLHANLSQLLACFEPIIRAQPGEWLAFYPVWQEG